MKKILVVDDCLSTACYVQDELERRGFASEIANNPKELKKALKKDRFDLVVFDFFFHTIGGGVNTNRLLVKLGYTANQRILFTKFRNLWSSIFCKHKPGLFEALQKKFDEIEQSGTAVVDKYFNTPDGTLVDAIHKLADEVCKRIGTI